MACTEFLKARVAPEIKFQVKAVADRDFLSEAAWLKRLILRELEDGDGAPAHRFARYLQLDAMTLMNETIEDRVCQSRLAEIGMPGVHG